MVRLNKPIRKSLSRKDLVEFPVWAWDDENENLLPISDVEPSTEYGNLFIRSNFQAESGQMFFGFLVGFYSYHAFGLFVNNTEFSFNINLNAEAKEDEKKIKQILGLEHFKLFPLNYESSVRLAGGIEIKGIVKF